MTRRALRVRSFLVRCAVSTALVLLPVAPVQAQLSPGPLAKVHSALEGATNCAKCHGLRREPMSQLCLSCHKDVQWMLDQKRGLHAREFTAGKKECASCHPDHAGVNFALVAWTEGSAARFDHRRAGWTLDGKHADVKCEKCHTEAFRVGPAAALSARKTGTGWIGLESSCASCHRDDDAHKNALGPKCESCHDSKAWKPAPKFDHARTNYPLTGKHADVACDKCHLAARLGIKANAKGERTPVFKPVPFTECSSCHEDPHKGRLSPKCGDCHVTRGFKIIDKKEFNHAVTRYPLEGKHRTASCESCHGAGMSRRSPPFASCADCHADAHRGEATLAGKPADCAACHRVQGFTPSTYSVADHQRAGFALGGRHQQVKCAACHAPAAADAATRAPAPLVRATKTVRIRVAHARCEDCHADVHGKQLAGRQAQGACEACHSDAGWKPSTYSTAAHARLRLPLDGRHAAIACAACHGVARPGLPAVAGAETFGSARVVFAVAETACASCHVDPHGGRYTTGGAVPLEGGCRTCHDTHAFRPATLSVQAHARFSFALDGAHRATPCVSCHAEMKAQPAPSTLLLAAKGVASLPYTAQRPATCQSCHETPHGDQFSARKDGGRCESCHGTESFAPANRFNHERDAAFKLAGAHAKVPCASCHKAVNAGMKGRLVVYRGLSSTCESCHGGRPPRGTP